MKSVKTIVAISCPVLCKNETNGYVQNSHNPTVHSNLTRNLDSTTNTNKSNRFFQKPYSKERRQISCVSTPQHPNKSGGESPFFQIWHLPLGRRNSVRPRAMVSRLSEKYLLHGMKFKSGISQKTVR
ncbi:hypothetical protein CEXT_767501 [Caerostris extrusa]|uniref:Uncharacterized protein n=1 Tax=Caerostris extrusa TaxID=172846 RepID=A0AAV4XPW1_CAEEX|nr:hypothetical protein CEXT_767501 [Caerostris extrusa]